METLLDYKYMRLEKEGKLAWLTFTREQCLNAMDNDFLDQIEKVAMGLSEEPDVRVAIIRGEGRAFSSGLDLKAFANEEITMEFFFRWEHFIRVFESMEKIVIVSMHGYCLGGAIQLALGCDIRVSTPDCQIGLPAIKESLIPGLGIWRLPRYIGMGRAKRLIFSGENIDGDEALRIGLVDYVVPSDNFFDHVDAIANKYLKTCSKGTQMCKLAINQAFDMDYEEIFQHYVKLQERTFFSLDSQEAKRAYLEKRAPKWQ